MMAEICGTTPDASVLRRDEELAGLHEGAGVGAGLDPLARRLRPGLVLTADPVLAPPQRGLAVAPLQLREPVRPRHGSTLVGSRPKVNGFIDSRRVFRR